MMFGFFMFYIKYGLCLRYVLKWNKCMTNRHITDVFSWLAQSQSQSHAGISVINQSRKWRRAPFCTPARFVCFLFHSVITTFSSLFTHFVLFFFCTWLISSSFMDFFYSAALVLFFSFVIFLCCQYLRSSAILYSTLRFLCQKNFYVLFVQWKTLNWVCKKWWVNQSTQQWWTKNKVNVMRNAKIKKTWKKKKKWKKKVNDGRKRT